VATPNVVIAGAPKCGTTSVFEWLSDHPEVCPSSVKETRYFMDEGHPLFKPESNYNRHGLEGYQVYFRKCERANPRVILEATPDYIYQRTALEGLARLAPRPKVVFVLRKPSDRVYSLYQFALNNMAVLDKRVSFGEFVGMIKAGCSEISEKRLILRQAIDNSRYVDYISKWLEKFGQDNLLVFLFEHLREDALGFMQRVSHCIGIAPAFWRGYGFPRKNESYRVRSRAIQRLARKLVKFIPKSEGLRAIYERFNAAPLTPKSAEDREVLEELDEGFAAYNDALSDMLNIDLSVWSRQAQASM